MDIPADFLVNFSTEEYYLDDNNILRNKQNGEAVVYIGGVNEKGLRGLEVTNQLADKTSSFQYIYGLLSQPFPRQDGMLISGTVAEILANQELDEWLKTTPPSEISRLQIYSIIAQLYYACSLLAELGWSCGEALSGVKVVNVDYTSTVPFFDGFIKTYGVTPIIYNLEAITQAETAYPKDVITTLLDNINITPHWQIGDFDKFYNTYQNIDMNIGMNWNDLIGENLWTSYSCPGNDCSDETGPGDYQLQLLPTEDDLFTSSNGNDDVLMEGTAEKKGNLEYQRDVWLLQTTNQPLPDYIQTYARAIQAHLQETYPNDQVFAINFNIDPQQIEEYLDLGRLQDLYFDISNEVSLIVNSRCRDLRKFVLSDILSGNVANEIYLRHDRIIPQLQAGDVVPFTTITVEDYNPNTQTFTVQQNDGNIILMGYDDLLQYLEQNERIRPYTDELIRRQNIALIDDQVQYINDETGQLFPLDINRLYVRDINNTLIQLLNNTQDMLSMAIAHLYGEECTDFN